MKQKLSISIDEEKVKIIEGLLKEGIFRSKSHILEYSLNKFLNIKNLSRDFCGSKILGEGKSLKGDGEKNE